MALSWRQYLKDMFSKKFAADLYQEIQDDNVFNGAAALAFFWMLAVFPFMIFLLSLLPYLPIPRLEEAIMDLLNQALPGDAAEMFTGVVHDITAERRGGLLSFGLLFAIWSGSTGIYAIMQQLNITYDVKEARSFMKARAVALWLMLLFVLLIVGAFALIIFGGVLEEWIMSVTGMGQVVITFFAVFRWIVIAVLVLLGFSVIYYYGPNVEQSFKFITPGSIIGAVLLILTSLGFSIYVSNFGDYNATYGTLGAVIILLMWLYIAGLVILIGSEVNAILEDYQAEGKQKGKRKM
jgi:membrane protein